jgi:hypothetical protein
MSKFDLVDCTCRLPIGLLPIGCNGVFDLDRAGAGARRRAVR